MNVTIFWVRATECMYTKTRSRFILSSERVLGEWSQNHVHSKGKKSPLPEALRRIEPAPLHHAGQVAQHTTNWAIPARILLIRWKFWRRGANRCFDVVWLSPIYASLQWLPLSGNSIPDRMATGCRSSSTRFGEGSGLGLRLGSAKEGRARESGLGWAMEGKRVG